MRTIPGPHPFFFSLLPFPRVHTGGGGENKKIININNKSMETMQTETSVEAAASDCPSCQQASADAAKNEETSLAFLLALLPVITLTFFGQVGLL